ncbi:MAG: hypothetical protein M1840_009174 [Geoglossum simile]|nr:MAG: hypothetical protein M1840_009174 [Geoglossum simile]
MAPKGGGRGGGSHSGSDSSGSSSKGNSDPTNWNLQTQLAGSHFKRPIVVAALAIACLCFVGILAVAAWSYAIKSNGRKVFKWFGMPLAIGAVILYMALSIINRFLHEFEVEVPASYVFIYVAAEYFLLKSSVFLLLIVYSIIKNRIQSIWKDVSRFRLWHLAHLFFGSALALVWIIDVITILIYYIKFLGSPIGSSSISAVSWLGRWRKVNGTFHVLYFIAAVDVMVCAAVIAHGARSRKVPSRISKYLLFLVAPVLLVRSLVLGIYAIGFTVLSHTRTEAANMAYVIFYGIPTVIVFAGLVLIATQGDWFSEYQAVQQGNVPADPTAYAPPIPHPTHNAYAGQNAYAAQGTYPAQNTYYGQPPVATAVPQPWTPWNPSPAPHPQPYYDTSYQRPM